MNTPMKISRRKGIALVIVLAVLVLVLALVVAFLARTGSERTAAASYRATARTRQLADTVVNLVQAQINQATTTLGGTCAWASQPGAIRQFDNAGGQKIFRLYSANTLTTGSYAGLANDLPTPTSSGSNWFNSPSEWVDLNAPVPYSVTGQANYGVAYPILDPRNPSGGDFTNGVALAGFQVNSGNLPGATAGTAPMPVQWLYVLQNGTIVAPNLAASTGTNVVLTGTAASAANPIVGRIAFWTDDDTCRLNINTAGDGTFWDTPHYTTPDEWIMAYYSPATYEYQRYPGHPATTSLLPLLNAVTDSGTIPTTPFPAAVPQYNPYTITLPTSGGNFSYQPIGTANACNPYQPVAYQNLFSLTPRYAYGGSAEASVPQSVVYNTNSPNFAASTPCPLNSQRLYPSIGELLFLSNTSTTPSARAANSALGSTTPILNRQQLETAKFFLTAHSRSPELNLFGTPRVSIWPLTVGTENFQTMAETTPPAIAVTLSGTQTVPASIRNTPTDQLLAFAATMSGSSPTSVTGASIYPFYFMRASNIDPFTDIDIMRNEPQTSGTQNQQVLAYLDNLMSYPVPGFGTVSLEKNANFANATNGKYSQTEARQILTEIFDYVRTTNTEDGDISDTTTGGAGLNYIYGQLWNNAPTNNCNWAGLGNVVPSLNPTWASTTGTLQGFGTFPRPTCVTIHFVTLGSGPIILYSGKPPVISGTAPAVNIPPQQFDYHNYTFPPTITATSASYTKAVLSGTTYVNVPVSGTAGVCPANTICVQAFVYVQFVMPASGRLDSNPPLFWITMKGLNNLGISTPLSSGTTLGFQSSASLLYNDNLGGGIGWAFGINGGPGNDQFVGPLPFFGEVYGGSGGPNGRASTPTPSGAPPIDNNSQYVYQFYSQPVLLPYNSGTTSTMTLTGGTNVVMQIQDTSANANVIQTVNLNFQAASQKGGSLPYPVRSSYLSTSPSSMVDPSGSDSYSTAAAANTFLSNSRIIGTADYVTVNSATNSVANPDVTQNDRWMEGVARLIDPNHDVTASLVLTPPWDDPRMLAVSTVPSSAFVAHSRWGQQMANDLIYSPEFCPMPGNLGTGKLVSGANYAPMVSATQDPATALSGTAWPFVESSSTNGVSFAANGPPYNTGSFGDWDNGPGYMSDGPWINRPDEGGASTGQTSTGAGNSTLYYMPYYTPGHGSTLMGPGIFSPSREVPSPAMFGSLPTGVDPTGANPQPWQTLLFRPGAVISHPGAGQPVVPPPVGQTPLPPYAVLPDHLLLDLFWMPVAEPYAISEPFSTAGKVNLNYQILPFGYVTTSSPTPYIKRDTGIRSALADLKIAAIPLSAANSYKEAQNGQWWGQFPSNFPNFIRTIPNGNLARIPIDTGQTLQQFDSVFTSGTIFESASQICDLYLVPTGYNLSTFSGSPSNAGSWYGSDFSMVGDNVRERPYADIYSRVTTKSNTFTVYFTVQELKNPPSAAQNVWNESTGSVVGEYRGSVDLERYIQQGNSLPDYLDNPSTSGTTSLEPYYRWRVLENNQFAP